MTGPRWQWKTLWVKAAGAGQFEIDSIPFFVNGIAVSDLVEASAGPTGLLHFARKVHSGGHSTIHVIMTADEVGPAVRGEIIKAGCQTERSPWPSLFSIDVPARALMPDVHRLLDARAAAGELEYVNACLAAGISSTGTGGDVRR
jgi:hypothetical protein